MRGCRCRCALVGLERIPVMPALTPSPRPLGPPPPGQAQRDHAPPARVMQVVLAYAVFAALWILGSDGLLGLLVSDPQLMARISLVKGWAFVGVTSVLLYGLMRRLLGRQGAAQAACWPTSTCAPSSAARRQPSPCCASAFRISARSVGGRKPGPRWARLGAQARRGAQPGLYARASDATTHGPPIGPNPQGRGDSRRLAALPARCRGQAMRLAGALPVTSTRLGAGLAFCRPRS